MPRRTHVSSGASGSDNAGTSNNNNEATNPESVTVDDRAPLWMFVKKISKYETGGSWRWQCNFYKLYYNGSHTRVEKHLLKKGGKGITICTKVNPQATAQIRKLFKDCKERIANRAARPVPLPLSTSQGSSATRGSYSLSYGDYTAPTSEGKKRRAAGGPLEKAFQNAAREECHDEIARMFYTGGLSFNLARNPYYRNSYMRASTLPGYVPPGYNALRTTLLVKERKNLEYQLEPLKLTWRDKGVSSCSDGWSDPQRKPLINVMAICESGPMMLNAVNCEGEYKDFNFISELRTESIKQVCYQNVVQVVTDNAPVYAKAGALIASKYSTIFWTPCVVHTLNLALKNIYTPSHAANNVDVYAKCSWIQPVVEDVMFIKNFIMNHGMRLVMFNDHCNLKLLSVAPTRFASAVIMLKRFKTIKNGLQQMVISTKWDDYKEDDSRKAGRVKEILLDDFMWDNI
ncbi:uncharacterized protein LOC126804583 [Argentina anserina]|uniref:uncharacterized protein LOC126804583 n=1 Tax=Argentina anserina TaxID=57926 RepID=UPI0021764163|nr:uncharacterized protein LOC126804583 [Potentilla anserina]